VCETWRGDATHLREGITLPPETQRVTLTLNAELQVSGLMHVPARARAGFVLAHGAGAGMLHPFMSGIAAELGARDIASLRYQFPYMEQGRKRSDPPALAHAAVRAAVAEAARLLPRLPLFAGGKSFGGRMTSQAQAAAPLPAVEGLVFLGFPLHPAGRPSQDRGRHLLDVQIPMLFLQGTRDQMARLDQLDLLRAALDARATFKLFQEADHGFRVPAHTGRQHPHVYDDMADAIAGWIDSVIARGGL
jgi:uncharacterized protein